MATFADTSALYALLDRDEENHQAAAEGFASCRNDDLVTHNYVVVETTALTQARLGMRETRQFLDAVLAAVEVVWVTPELHANATAALLAAGTKGVSLVDRVSFAFMRQRGLRRAFAFDRDFRREGFALVP